MSNRTRWWLFASLTVVLLLAFAGCTAAPAAAPEGAAPAEEAAEAPAEEAAEAPAAAEGEQVIIYGLYQEPELLNAYIRTQTVASEAARYMDEGLVQASPEGEYYAVLATEVPSQENGGISEDGLTITYNLRDDIVWSDGEPFTCEDVVFTWEAVMHPESGAVNASSFASIESVTCVDDYTVVVQYSEFFAPFLSNFNSILPKHATGEPAEMTRMGIQSGWLRRHRSVQAGRVDSG